MNIVILDYKTLGDDLDLSGAERYGSLIKYPITSAEEAPERLRDADIVIVNKVKMNEHSLKYASHLKLICETATGYDNIDIEYCKKRGIGVANTPAYSTPCVAQITVAMVCSLITHLNEYRDFVHGGKYQQSGTANRLEPVYHELSGHTWGIIGFGNIGRGVAAVANAFGCRVLVNKRSQVDDFECVSLNELLRRSDIITIHCPLTNETRGMLAKSEFDIMKENAIVVNVARGAVWDEAAAADAILNGKIGALGCDVFSYEPIDEKHPFSKILHLPNVILTPHMAWGSFESRTRCYNTVISNIDAFLSGKEQNRIV